jgi:hypothetical protein
MINRYIGVFLKSRMLKKVFLLVFISVSITFLSENLFSQYILSKHFLPPNKKSKITKDLIFHSNETVNGTKIVAKLKQPVYKEHKRAEEDTSKSENRIVSLRETNDGFKLYLDLADYDQRIEIAAYNMLGKKVETFFEGQADKYVEYYSINTSRIPNGIYLLSVTGDKITNGRLAKKFIVSR